MFFSFKIVCSFIDLLILIIFSEYNAVVLWYFSFLKHSDRYHFLSIGICSNLEIFLINLYHLYIRKTICERYFMINLKFFNIIFLNKFSNICEKIIFKKFAVRQYYMYESKNQMWTCVTHDYIGILVLRRLFFQMLLPFSFLHILPDPGKLRLAWSTFQ